tara:strand:+ start:3495 stop:4772 length:1278 start_codon:yes stop_codon:yes gene_type:complete
MAISPFFKPTKVIRPAGGGLISAAKNNIRSLQTKTQNISEPRSDNKSQKFGSAYTNFFGSKKTVKILQKNLTAIKKSLAATFEIAMALRKAIAQTAKGFGGGGKKGGLFGGLFGAIGAIGGLFGLIGGLASILTNPWLLSIIGAGSALAAIKIIFGKGGVEEYIRGFVAKILAETILPGINDNQNTNQLQMDQTIAELGPSDALAVFKGQLAILEDERGILYNPFSDDSKQIRDLTSRIENMEGQGVKTGEMSGSKFETNLLNFGIKVENRSNLEKEFHTKKNESLRNIRLRRMKTMPQELKELMLSDPTNAKVTAYNKETRRQVLEAEATIRKEYLNKIKNIEVKKDNQTNEVSSSNKNNNNMARGKLIPFNIGGGKQTGNEVNKVFSPNGNPNGVSSDIAWFNSRNTDMYGCFKTAAECNITV